MRAEKWPNKRTDLWALLAAVIMISAPNISNASVNSPSGDLGSGYGTILIIAWMLIVAVGIFSGWRKSITVFRNYDDLALVFFIGSDVIAALLIIWGYGKENQWLTTAIIVIATLLFLGLMIAIVKRTWTDNPSIVPFSIALVTKISLAALFLINLVSLIRPSGKTQLQRSKTRASALGWLLVVTPIIAALVRDSEGIWAPKNIMNRYQRGKLGL